MNERKRSLPRSRRIYAGLVDVLVVGACALTFVGVIGIGKGKGFHEPPLALIAAELGTTPERLRAVSEAHLLPRPMPPSEAQRRSIAAALDVPLDLLDSVMTKYRPVRLPGK
jgi:hypothetical protein